MPDAIGFLAIGTEAHISFVLQEMIVAWKEAWQRLYTSIIETKKKIFTQLHFLSANATVFAIIFCNMISIDPV